MEAIQNKIKGVIVGCGKIAGIFDKREKRPSADLYSYCSSIANSKILKLEGCADIDLNKAKKLAAQFEIPKVSNDYVDLLNSIQPEFVIVATPDETHFDIVKRILSLKKAPSLIIVEKPVCLSMEQFKFLKNRVLEKKVNLIVNHSRRFDPRFQDFKEKITTSRFGDLFRLDLFFYGNWNKNGIHLMDTIAFLMGDKIDLEFLKISKKRIKLKKTNWIDLSLNFGEHFIVNIHHNPEKFYQIFEMDFKFEKGRVLFKDFENKVSIEEKKINYLHENILEQSKLKFSPKKKSNMVLLIKEAENFFNKKTNLDKYSINQSDLTMNLFFKIFPYYED